MLTREERTLKICLKIWIFLFAMASLLFLSAPSWVITQLNFFSAQIAPRFPLLSSPSEHFWLSLTGSLMITLIALLYGALQDFRRRKDLVVYVLISKITSASLFFIFFFVKGPFAYFLGFLTDGIIFLITLILYRQAVRSSQLIL